MPLTSTERSRKHRASGKATTQTAARRFIGFDGEGAGTDELGRQDYLLIRAGDATGRFLRQLYTGARLKTWECLEFILALPRDACIVVYYGGYDVTQILRDLPRAQLDGPHGVFTRRARMKGVSPYTYYGSYGIEYVPRQYFRVCRLDKDHRTILDTSVTINEVGGFFQAPFVKALTNWGIGSKDELAFIGANKDKREEFVEITDEINDYCKLECKYLARLMTKFRETCVKAEIVPRQWRGAGHIAARLHEINLTPKRKALKRSKVLDEFASWAYYGGRFEITSIGRFVGDIWEYDIASAYPDAMRKLPCPLHTKWKRFRGDPPEDHQFYVADCTFSHPRDVALCGLPIREKGRLYFPREGTGIYWSPEIEAAREAGATVDIRHGYYCTKACDCRPFDWINALYEYRLSVGKATIGFPIKLGINGLYGKFAQRLGGAPWQDYIAAGLITSLTRAKLIHAYRQAPDSILYIATDALYSRSRLKLDIGDGLGQWEEKRRDGMFIVQPGIYWSDGGEPKTRGVPRSRIIEHREAFETIWNNWLDAGGIGDPPSVPVFVNQFIGTRLALARNKPETAGQWLADLRWAGPVPCPIGVRNIDFNWQSKRRPQGDYITGQALTTVPYNGGPFLRSQKYDGTILTDLQQRLLESEADPDYIPWGNSGE